MPTWLTAVATLSLALAAVCAVWIAVDVARHPPRMGVMAVVWPVSALFGSVGALWFYRRHGRAGVDDDPTMPVSVAKGALHCGAGCTLGDVVAETTAFLAPAVLVPFGFPGLFGDRMFAVWVLDFVAAFVIGIAFQYFAIAPMRDLTVARGVWAALKADALSLTAWQVGMYGTMAVLLLGVLQPLYGTRPEVSSPVFWLAMQVAMLGGFATAFPMNWWLVRRGVKERM